MDKLTEEVLDILARYTWHLQKNIKHIDNNPEEIIDQDHEMKIQVIVGKIAELRINLKEVK